MNETTNHQPDKRDQGRVARRRARVRADLLAAARQVFTTRGYQDTTVSEIIQTADIAMGTFYLHFRDKEEIFLALAQEALHQVRAQIHEALAHHPDELAIPLLIRTLLRAAYEQRDLFLLICVGESHFLTHTHTHQAQEGLAEHFIAVLQQAKERGELASGDPVLLAHLLVGMLLRAIRWWFEQDEPGPDAMADQMLSLLEQGLPTSLLREKGHPREDKIDARASASPKTEKNI